MPEMTESEYRKFMTEGTKTGKLATVNEDGSPHVTPIWYCMDGDDFVFTTGGNTLKALNMKRDRRVSMSVEDQAPPYSFVRIDGTASISSDPEEMLKWATRIGGRYMGAENAEAFGKRNSSEGEVLVRLRPSKIIAYSDVTAW